MCVCKRACACDITKPNFIRPREASTPNHHCIRCRDDLTPPSSPLTQNPGAIANRRKGTAGAKTEIKKFNNEKTGNAGSIYKK